MTEHTTFYTPQTVAQELDVSSATLRRWSQNFSNHLTPEASGSEPGTHRRYTDEDVAILRIVKELMNNGLTYEQVNQQLGAHADPSQEHVANISLESDPTFDDENDHFAALEQVEKGLVVSNGDDAAVVSFLTNTLATLSESQKSILNSQAANRELMGVLIQDNFNLKEENNRLRERILDVERNLAQSRQDNDWQRETVRQELDAKIASIQQLATEAIRTAHETPAPDIKAVKSKPGCLGALFGGGGDIKIVSVPKPREKRADGQPIGRTPPAAVPPPYAPQPPPPAHPKPTAPPE